MSAKDLIPLNQRSPDERREIARKGAAASNEVQRKKRNLKKVLQAIIDSPTNDTKAREELERAGIEDTKGALMLMQAVQTAGKNPLMLEKVMHLLGYRLTAGGNEGDKPEVHIYIPSNNRDNTTRSQ